MQPMCDGLAVLGGRHGVIIDPIKRECSFVRCDSFLQLRPFQLRAGVIIDGTEYVLPLCRDGATFDFCDQRISPCTISLMGIHAASYLKLKLTIATPFRPRDVDFSTTPVIAFRLEAEQIAGFRGQEKTIDLDKVEIFLEFTGDDTATEVSGTDAIDFSFSTQCYYPIRNQRYGYADEGFLLPQRDKLVVTQGERVGTRFTQRVPLGDEHRPRLEVAWCAHCEPVLEIMGTRHPFKYTERFADLVAVAEWARTHTEEIFENARRVDGIIAQNDCDKSVNNLLALTLHSWLLNTWWVLRDGNDWFSVWEGSCFLHSTVDVEFTQAPFYLAVWPELLRLELDAWPEFSKDGTLAIGERGADTLFLSHDTGWFLRVDGQFYQHEMEVEETTNYLIMAYAYWRRTGDDSIIRAHADVMRKYLAFLAACDTTGNGAPDLGVSSTIDDACIAVQFGTQPVYLSVKVLGAYLAGASMLDWVGEANMAAHYRALADIVRATIDRDGWLGDHYATLIEKSGTLVNPWTHDGQFFAAIPGWDAPHIYTANALPALDMVGLELGLDADHLRTDLRVATRRCLREYGCIHADTTNDFSGADAIPGFVVFTSNPGWVSMNMVRDLAAFYRGVDLRPLANRYWEWQTTTNGQSPAVFFETFGGSNLCFYPRGVAIWGIFDALAGLKIDKVTNIDAAAPAFLQIRVPRLLDADWQAGTCQVIDTTTPAGQHL